MTDPAEDAGRALSAARRRLVLLDFDGTLAPFSPDPGAVTLPTESRGALAAWMDVPRTEVAVVSGRPRSDLLGRLPQGVTAIGSHGAESDLWEGEARAPFPREAIRAWIRSRIGDPAGLQEKPFGLAVNLRGLSEAEERRVAKALGERCPVPGVRTLRGHAIIEYVSECGWTKGKAALMLADRFGAPPEGILAVGDDVTDEDMFEALPGTASTVKVGPGDTTARLRIASQAEVAGWLRAAARAVHDPIRS